MRLLGVYGLVWVCVSGAAGQDGAQNSEKEILQWKEIDGRIEQAVADEIIAGVSGDALVLFDGQSLSVLEREAENQFTWHKDLRLDFPPRGVAMVSTDLGILCIGGADTHGCVSEIFALQWDPEKKN